MIKFEIGKRYSDGTITFEITGRTGKTIKFITIQHAGKVNERKSEEKKAKICNWDNREVFVVKDRTIEAI